MSDDDDDPFAGLAPEDGAPEAAALDELAPDVAAVVATCAGFEMNDFGNALRFAAHFGADLLHAGQLGWHDWDGRRWCADHEVARDLSPKVRARAHRLGPLIAAEVRHILPAPPDRPLLAEAARLARDLAAMDQVPEEGRGAAFTADLLRLRRDLALVDKALEPYRKRLARRLAWARAAGNSAAIANFTREAVVLLSCDHGELDRDPLAVNTLSGVLRFSVTWAEGMSAVAEVRLEPHDRAARMSKIMPVDYLPGAACPQFDAFLAEVLPNPEMRDFILRWLGLSMLGVTVQALAFWYGSGANGKSVLSDIATQIMGSYAATARIKSLTGVDRRGGGDATPDLVPLIGARYVRASEPREGEPLQEELIKELTGGEPMMVRSLHSNFVTILPVFKLTITGNHKPVIRGTDDGIWRRLMLVPFDVQIPEARRERGLADRLVREEGPGILNRLVEGALAFLEGGLAPPAQVVDATREYREESDPVGAFLDAVCVITGDGRDSIPARELGEAFNFWLSSRGEGTWKERTVALKLKDKAGRWKSRATGQAFVHRKASTMHYDGIALVEPFRTTFRDAPRDQHGRVLRPRADAVSGGDE